MRRVAVAGGWLVSALLGVPLVLFVHLWLGLGDWSPVGALAWVLVADGLALAGPAATYRRTTRPATRIALAAGAAVLVAVTSVRALAEG